MKELLYEEYVKGAGDEIWNQIRVYTNPEPRRLILATRPNRKVKKAPPKEPSLLKHLSREDGTTTSSILLQEEPPDQSPNRQAVPLDAPIKLPNQVSATIPCSIIHDLDIMHTDLLCPDKFKERLGCLENYVEHNPCLRSHLEKKQAKFSFTEIGIHQTDLYADYSMTVITHLSFAKDLKFMTGTKAETSGGDISMAKFIPGWTRKIILSVQRRTTKCTMRH